MDSITLPVYHFAVHYLNAVGESIGRDDFHIAANSDADAYVRVLDKVNNELKHWHAHVQIECEAVGTDGPF